MPTSAETLAPRLQSLFAQAAAAVDAVEQDLVNSPLQKRLKRLQENFTNKHWQLLIAPVSPEQQPLLIAALARYGLSSLPDPAPCLYSLVPQGYPRTLWNIEMQQSPATGRSSWWVAPYSSDVMPQPMGLHVLTDPQALMKSPILLGNLVECVDLIGWIGCAGTPPTATAIPLKAMPWWTARMIDWNFTPSSEAGNTAAGADEFQSALQADLDRLLDPDRYEGYRLIAAARQLAQFKTLLHYAIQCRQEQLKAGRFEAARRKKKQEEDYRIKTAKLGALKSAVDTQLEGIREDFLQKYRYYQRGATQPIRPTIGRTTIYCYPFNIVATFLLNMTLEDLDQQANNKSLFNNCRWRELTRKIGTNKYTLYIKQMKIDSIAKQVKETLERHLRRECRGLNRAITHLQGTLQQQGLKIDLRQLPENPDAFLLTSLSDERLIQALSIEPVDNVVFYGLSMLFRKIRMQTVGGMTMLMVLLTPFFGKEIAENLKKDWYFWLPMVLIFFWYVKKELQAEQQESLESTFNKIRLKLQQAIEKVCRDIEEEKKRAFSKHLDAIRNQITTESDRLRAPPASRDTAEVFLTRKATQIDQLTAPRSAFSLFSSELDNPSLKNDLQKLQNELQKA